MKKRYGCCYDVTIDFETAENETEMNKQQVIKNLKDILLSNDFEGKEQQENALIIAIAELLKE